VALSEEAQGAEQKPKVRRAGQYKLEERPGGNPGLSL
jgi:hypothetical protein